MLTDDGIELSADHRRRLGIALRRGLLRLDRTVEDSLSYAELKAGSALLQFEEVEVGVLVKNAVEVARAIADLRSKTIEVRGLERRHFVSGDHPWLLQMLTNILDNAVERAPDHSTVEVCVSRENGFVRIAVADHGNPMSEDERALIFEEYYRGTIPDRHVASSLGLSLAAAKRIAEEHGGSITVASELRGPTTFTITLPAAR
jgi:signal transduction histidine kinase